MTPDSKRDDRVPEALAALGARVVEVIEHPESGAVAAPDPENGGPTLDRPASHAQAPPAVLAGAHAPPPGDDDGPEHARLDESWARVDLGPTLRGELPEIVPTLLRRDDGAGLFTAGRVNGIHGDSGTGKSWAAAIANAQELHAGRHVVWVDFEDPDPSTLVGRLRDDLDVTPDAIAERLHYFGPLEPFDELAVEAIVAESREYAVTLTTVDSLGEAFGLEGIDENKDVDVAPWLRRVARRLADAGPGVLLLDHSTKAADNPLHPSGSKRKRAAITGQSYLLDSPVPLTRDTGGRLTLTTAKDRHGHYRRGQVTAVVEFTRHPDSGMTVHVRAPDATESTAGAPTAKLERVARAAVTAAKDAGRPISTRSLTEAMTVKASIGTKRAGIDEALARGALRTEDGPRRAVLHVYVRDLPDRDECPES